MPEARCANSSLSQVTREFVGEHKARLGVVVTTDVAVSHYEDNLIGVPFTHL